LLKSAKQEKLSKSQKASPIYLARHAGLSRDELFQQFAQWLGIQSTANWNEICHLYFAKTTTLSII
jgi:hypothetical protein